MADILNNNPQPDDSIAPVTQDITSHVSVVSNDEYVVKDPPPHGLDSSWRRWKCLICGYVYEGLFKGEMICPKCGNKNPDKFDEAE